MRKALAIALTLLLVGSCRGGADSTPEAAFPSLYQGEQPFLAAIRETRAKPLSQRITGITVPHHLLAADLMAAAFARLASQSYDRIVILSPDHFSRSRTAFAVTFRDFRTPLGTLHTDRAAVQQLLANPRVSVSQLFSHEHGVQALLPFVAYHFPQARIVALALSRSAQRPDWDSLARTLAPLLTPGTLVIQSTDFSHYLPRDEARRKDQETLRVLSGGHPEDLMSLTEPGHLDSRAAQYLQWRLQQALFGARPFVTANRNSQDYTAEPLNRTTSYIVQLYSPEALVVDGVESWFFAGDTFFGRFVATSLAAAERRQTLVEQVLRLTRGHRLIVNLEGVIRDACPEQPGPWELCMETGLALPLLKALNVQAVSLANNHSHDFGADSYQEMKRILHRAGIIALEPGSVTDLGPFRLAAFTDVDNQGSPRTALLTEPDLQGLGQVSHDKPLFALVHWGREYAAAPGPREELLGSSLEAQGVELIIGSHPHRAGGLACSPHACRAFSLGNFIFDQRRPEASGALLEVIFFPPGTYFLRWHQLGNLYSAISLN